MAARFAVEVVSVAEIRPFRFEYLRKGTPSENVVFPEDDLPSTRHLAVRHDGGRFVAISSWSDVESPDRPGSPALQLRGMAVSPDTRRRGLGEALIEAGVALAAERGAGWVWANARDTALDFYRSVGFEVVGDGFLTADTRLPHHRILRAVAP
mgnify:CR=1 FL=1